jgi:hypothetical protein
MTQAVGFASIKEVARGLGQSVFPIPNLRPLHGKIDTQSVRFGMRRAVFSWFWRQSPHAVTIPCACLNLPVSVVY